MYMSSHSVNAMKELKSEERHSHTAIDLQYVHVQGEEQSGFGARQGQTKFIHFTSSKCGKKPPVERTGLGCRSGKGCAGACPRRPCRGSTRFSRTAQRRCSRTPSSLASSPSSIPSVRAAKLRLQHSAVVTPPQMATACLRAPLWRLAAAARARAHAHCSHHVRHNVLVNAQAPSRCRSGRRRSTTATASGSPTTIFSRRCLRSCRPTSRRRSSRALTFRTGRSALSCPSWS